MASSGTNNKRSAKAADSKQEVIWPGLRRCLECGMPFATDTVTVKEMVNGKLKDMTYAHEKGLHSTYHGYYRKMKLCYGESNVLSFETLREYDSKMSEHLSGIKEYCLEDFAVDINSIVNNVMSTVDEIDEWYISTESVKAREKSIVDYIIKIREVYNSINSFDTMDDFFKFTNGICGDYIALLTYANNFTNAEVMKMISDYKDIPVFYPTFDIQKQKKYIEDLGQTSSIKGKVDGILDIFFKVEFTKSLRLWDYSNPHPRFEDYKVLLWNTPKFQKFIRQFMTEAQYEEYIENNRANRQLVDYKFVEAPYYFGRVKSSQALIDAGEDAEKISSLIDISYMDKLVEEGEIKGDEKEVELTDEELKEYENQVKAMEGLGKVINS